MKIKDSHRRDFWAYVWFARKVNGRTGKSGYFCPEPHYFERGNGDALKCFVEYESTGKMKAKPKQPILLKLVFDGKRLLNLHVEQWAEGLAEGTFIPWELRYYLFKLPDWVGEGLHKQWLKLAARNLKKAHSSADVRDIKRSLQNVGE